jgi:hypothetical protein
LSALNLPEARPGVNNNYQQLVKLSNIDKMIKIMIKPWSRAGQPGRGRHALTWTAQTCLRFDSTRHVASKKTASCRRTPTSAFASSPPPIHQSSNPPIQSPSPPAAIRPSFVTACHGFVTALSRLQTHERPVFIDLSRCHGSRGVNTPPTPLPLVLILVLVLEQEPPGQAQPARA